MFLLVSDLLFVVFCAVVSECVLCVLFSMYYVCCWSHDRLARSVPLLAARSEICFVSWGGGLISLQLDGENFSCQSAEPAGTVE